MRRFVTLVDGRNYPVLSTLNADGSPQSSVMWIGRDGDDLLFCTVAGRQKERNLQRDPRSASRLRPRGPVELRGDSRTATITTEDALKLDDELSFKYDNKPKDPIQRIRTSGRTRDANEGDGLRRVTGDWPISRLTIADLPVVLRCQSIATGLIRNRSGAFSLPSARFSALRIRRANWSPPLG